MRVHFARNNQEDEQVAISVRNVFEKNKIETYLDVLDESLCGNGEKLTKHIREELHKCTDIIVILSANTRQSWWVPFEIGMASEKDLPIANFLISSEQLPDFLEYWPRLKNSADVGKYIEVRKKMANKIINERNANAPSYFEKTISRMETERFYDELKKQL